VGQVLNLTGLGNEVGIDHKTVRAWLSVLETSFIVFLLRPYHRNWSKRVVKQPKLYFYDTGLLCSLLGLRTASDIALHPLRGPIFESFIIAEHFKQRYHAGDRPSAFFWRDHSGHEVDLLVERGGSLSAVEIKSGETVTDDFFRGLRWFSNQSGVPAQQCAVVYGGDQSQDRAAARVIPWREACLQDLA
jgi:predicted AAA+ superfamily ATPase